MITPQQKEAIQNLLNRYRQNPRSVRKAEFEKLGYSLTPTSYKTKKPIAFSTYVYYAYQTIQPTIDNFVACFQSILEHEPVVEPVLQKRKGFFLD